MPNGATNAGFADDIAIVSASEMVNKIEEKTNTVIRMIGAWLDRTEAVMISGRKTAKKMRMIVERIKIESKRTIKHLGVIIDDRVNFKKHVKYICEKASVTQGGALAKTMPNIEAPSPFKMKIISSVITSIALNACPI